MMTLLKYCEAVEMTSLSRCERLKVRIAFYAPSAKVKTVEHQPASNNKAQSETNTNTVMGSKSRTQTDHIQSNPHAEEKVVSHSDKESIQPSQLNGEAETGAKITQTMDNRNKQVSIPLQFARLVKMTDTPDAVSENTLSFQVFGNSGNKTEILQCDTLAETMSWMDDISDAISAQNMQFIYENNLNAGPEQQWSMLGWVLDCTNNGLHSPRFLVLRGDNISIFDQCPFQSSEIKEWKPVYEKNILESLFRFVSYGEMNTIGAFSIVMQCDSEPSSRFRVETANDLTRWKNAIRECTNAVVYRVKKKDLLMCVGWKGVRADH